MWGGTDVRFMLGLLAGVVVAFVMFWWTLIRGGAKVEVVRGEVRALDALGERLAGPALVRGDEVRIGAQDLLLAPRTPWRFDRGGGVHVLGARRTDVLTILADDRPIAAVTLGGPAPEPLRISMFRGGAGVTPVGFRNGVRAAMLPVTHLARRLRGG